MERLDAFMARANARYYASHDPFADFTTSPEISQVFGELLGCWAAIVWEQMGRPAPVVLAELGPGRGTLMADALRAIRATAPDFAASLCVHLVETSPLLREQQAERVSAIWHEQVEDLPPLPTILLANEFLDALPVRQFIRNEAGWSERWVADGRFVDVAAPEFRAAGAVAEIGDAATRVIELVATSVRQFGGAALFIDYGAASGGADTLQAIRNGSAADPLATPGESDLTAHVDFGRLAEAARRQCAAVHGPLPQGVFLTRLGLFQRTDRLARTQPPAKASALLAGASRLAEPTSMGQLFKVMAITHPDLPTPPGFSA